MKNMFGVFGALAALLFFAGCGPSTFILNKDGVAAYFGREEGFLHTLLCDAGDLKKVLSETGIPGNIQQDLYRYNCTAERSAEKLISLYLYLSPEEKLELQRAFKKHDYVINYINC